VCVRARLRACVCMCVRAGASVCARVCAYGRACARACVHRRYDLDEMSTLDWEEDEEFGEKPEEMFPGGYDQVHTHSRKTDASSGYR
jgi:hypothetical protein